MQSPEDIEGVIPDRPNHEMGCVCRYGATPEDGIINCACPHRDDPTALVPPWPDDAEHTRRWLETARRWYGK